MATPSVYLDNLIKRLTKLPGIGPRSASRLAFHMLNMKTDEVDALTSAMEAVKLNIKECTECGGISDGGRCTVCEDLSRDRSVICIVAEPRDMLTLEATGSFSGVYHVLRGLISPLDGIGPDDIKIDSLLKRCEEIKPEEVIIALNPTIEGDATTLYISRALTPMGIKITRIARGLPVGADLEFADRATIIRSFEGRSLV